jgi:hypothetical protein
MTDLFVLIDYPPWCHKSVLPWSFTKASQSIQCSHLNSWLLCIQWNFINLALMETDRCQIMKYSGLTNSTYTDQSSYRKFLGTFTKLWRVTISFILSVSMHGPAWFPLDRFSWNLIFHCFSKSLNKVQAALQSGKNNGYVTWRPICVCVFFFVFVCVCHCGDFLLLVTIVQILQHYITFIRMLLYLFAELLFSVYLEFINP